jgi:CheY-like chemotaxis protein
MPTIDRLQPALARANMDLADCSKTPAEVAHIKPLPPSQKASVSNPHVAQTQTTTDGPGGRIISGDFVPSSSKKIVAVVDDDPEMREAAAALLSAYGYGTETFDSAEAFLAAAATSQASCLVTDIQLGDISGVELVHQLAADGYKYPTIFITALDDEWITSKVAAAGGIALLTKPFPSNLLIEAIVKAIG